MMERRIRTLAYAACLTITFNPMGCVMTGSSDDSPNDSVVYSVDHDSDLMIGHNFAEDAAAIDSCSGGL